MMQPFRSPSAFTRANVRRVGVVGSLVGATLLAMAVQPAWSQDDPLVAKVNGVEIRQSDLALAEEDLGQNIPQQYTGDAKRDYLVAYLTDVILVAKAAESRKVADTKDFKTRYAFARNKLLMESLLQSVAKEA